MQQRRRGFPGGKLGSPAQGVSPPVSHQGAMVRWSPAGPRLSRASTETRIGEVRSRGCCPALQRGRRSIQSWLSIGRCGWIVVLRLSADAEVCQCQVCPEMPLDGDLVRCRQCLLYLCGGRPPKGLVCSFASLRVGSRGSGQRRPIQFLCVWERLDGCRRFQFLCDWGLVARGVNEFLLGAFVGAWRAPAPCAAFLIDALRACCLGLLARRKRRELRVLLAYIGVCCFSTDGRCFQLLCVWEHTAGTVNGCPRAPCDPTFLVLGMNIPLPLCAGCVETVRGGCAPMPMSNGAPPLIVHFMVLRILTWYFF